MSKSNEQRLIFRVCVLGKAESGKTTLCSQVVGHSAGSVYQHTPRPAYFVSEVSSRRGNALRHRKDKSNGKGKRRGAKAEAASSGFGLQLLDTPGEMSKDIVAGTDEYDIIRYKNQPPGKDLYDTNFSQTDQVGLGEDEGSSLLQTKGDVAPSAKAQKSHLHVNSLLQRCTFDAYIVVYDASEGSHRNSSCEKAWNILKKLKAIHGGKKSRGKKKDQRPKFFLFANKYDQLTVVERNRMRMTQLSNIRKEDRSGEDAIQFAMGSSMLNEATSSADTKPMPLADYLFTVCKVMQE